MDDKKILYDLASRVREIAQSDAMNEKRRLWRKQNSLKGDRPLIYLRTYAFEETFDRSVLKCTDPMLREYEKKLHESIYRSQLGDDFIIEPWLTMQASYEGGSRWGVPLKIGAAPKEGGAANYYATPSLVDEDLSGVKVPHYKVDEKATALASEKLEEALGGAMPVYVSRQGLFYGCCVGISYDLAILRGYEPLMWDVYDNPEWLHQLLGIMRDGILQHFQEVEEAGGLTTADHENQGMTYSEELEDPNINHRGVSHKELWGYLEAEEFTCFGPEQTWEFMIQYQLPIMEKYGLTSYGCCEDLSEKIVYLRQLKNLRRISVSPFANVRKCAEEIGEDYVLSWRPDPSLTICNGLDEDFLRKYMREYFEIFKENKNHFDITLANVETVHGHPEYVKRWTEIVREEINCFCG